jgi:phosphatidylglycerophosphate synthase
MSQSLQSTSRPYVKPLAPWHDKYWTDPVTAPVVEVLAQWPAITPNQVTWCSFAVAMGAAWLFSLGGPVNWALGAVLWEIAYLVDGIDGKLARRTNRTSATGALLDNRLDKVKKVVCLTAIVATTTESRVLLSGLILLHYALHYVTVRPNAGVLKALNSRGIKAIFDPLDELFFLLFLGPLLSIPVKGALLTIGAQALDLAVHLAANMRDTKAVGIELTPSVE